MSNIKQELSVQDYIINDFITSFLRSNDFESISDFFFEYTKEKECIAEITYNREELEFKLYFIHEEGNDGEVTAELVRYDFEYSKKIPYDDKLLEEKYDNNRVSKFIKAAMEEFNSGADYELTIQQ